MDYNKYAKRNWLELAEAPQPSKHATPDELWAVACSYFQSIEEAPYLTYDAIRVGALAGELKVVGQTDSPFTWGGLDRLLMDHEYYSTVQYKSNPKKFPEYQPVIERIGTIIDDRKLSMGLVGGYNASIVARDLGLADKQEIVEEKESVDLSKYSDDELKKALGRD